jgi:putative membrane protein (TIGR04086 family)
MLAVLVGYCALIILLLIGGAVLNSFLHNNTRALIVGGTVVTFLCGVISGGITARMAPSRPLAHATVLGLTIFSVLTIVTAISKRPPNTMYPPWYPFAAAFLAGAGAIFGGSVASGSDESPADSES